MNGKRERESAGCAKKTCAAGESGRRRDCVLPIRTRPKAKDQLKMMGANSAGAS
jgi:hypothetical protein